MIIKINLKKRRRQSGFTLIELIVVMAILALLAALGLRSFRSSQIKGRDAQRKHDLSQLQRALEFYYNDNGAYPETDEFPGPDAEWRDPDSGTLYIKSIPSDPAAYSYEYISDSTSYKILAYLENQNDREIQACIVSLGIFCGSRTCNYGVSSANLRVCESPYP